MIVLICITYVYIFSFMFSIPHRNGKHRNKHTMILY